MIYALFKIQFAIERRLPIVHTYDERLDSNTTKTLNDPEFMMAFALGGVYNYTRQENNSSSYVKFMGRVRNSTTGNDIFYPLHPCNESELAQLNNSRAKRLRIAY